MNAPIRVLLVAGARPNFMKVGPLLHALEEDSDFEALLVHTGQHYDSALSDDVLRDLGIRAPDYHLGVGSGSHARQTAAVMVGIEPILLDAKPDLVVVVGDVNSTVAAALTAAKLNIPVAHVEAGLRSRDRRMPEELNRIVTDQLSELLLTPSPEAEENLLAEGIDPDRIHFVGNIMIDALQESLAQAKAMRAWEGHGLEEGAYGLVTLHRPSNVDRAAQLEEIFSALEEFADELPLLFPMHPRTRKSVERFEIGLRGVTVVDPVSYLEMLSLQSGAAIVLTDSGGMQEETTVLGVPCLTLRSSTERPVTISQGTNELVPVRSRAAILEAARRSRKRAETPSVPEFWDGQTGGRVRSVIRGWAEARAPL